MIFDFIIYFCKTSFKTRKRPWMIDSALLFQKYCKLTILISYAFVMLLVTLRKNIWSCKLKKLLYKQIFKRVEFDAAVSLITRKVIRISFFRLINIRIYVRYYIKFNSYFVSAPKQFFNENKIKRIFHISFLCVFPDTFIVSIFI